MAKDGNQGVPQPIIASSLLSLTDGGYFMTKERNVALNFDDHITSAAKRLGDEAPGRYRSIITD